MGDIAYYNGCFSERDELRIPITDRSFFFGDAVYDMMIGEGGLIHQAEEHIERLFRSAALIGIRPSFTQDDLLNLAYLAVEKSRLGSYSVYAQISRCSKKRIHSYHSSGGENLLITVEEHKLKKEVEYIKLITLEDLRYRYCNVKTVNLLPAVLASGKAEEAGCEEAIFYRGRTVTECAHSNVSIIKNGAIYTHPNSDVILPGITRKHLLATASLLGIPTYEIPFTVADLYSADEILISSTTKLLRFAKEIDGIKVGGRCSSLAALLYGGLLDEYEKNCHK